VAPAPIGPLDITQIWAEVAKIQSWSVVDRVIAEMGLMSDPEINPDVNTAPGRLTRIVQTVSNVCADVYARISQFIVGDAGGDRDAMREPDIDVDARHIRAIQSFLDRLNVPSWTGSTSGQIGCRASSTCGSLRPTRTRRRRSPTR
jgi:hypothetical protein